MIHVGNGDENGYKWQLIKNEGNWTISMRGSTEMFTELNARKITMNKKTAEEAAL